MSRFEHFAADAAHSLADEHGELLWCTPVGQSRRRVRCIIHRTPVEMLGPDEVRDWPIELDVPKADLARPTVGDVYAIKRRPHDTTTTDMVVGEVLDGDGAMWRLRLR